MGIVTISWKHLSKAKSEIWAHFGKDLVWFGSNFDGFGSFVYIAMYIYMYYIHVYLLLYLQISCIASTYLHIYENLCVIYTDIYDI